jgi:histidyl-tRNA synthetase
MAHFDELKSLLDALGIPFEVSPKLVRGLDYYTRTVFEFVDPKSGLTACGGGRYDNLIEEVGGPSIPAVGFAAGLERIIQMRGQLGEAVSGLPRVELFIGSIGDAGYLKSQALANKLRQNGVSARSDILRRGVKAQMKYADKIKAEYSMIIGDQELASSSASIKNMSTGEQAQVPFDALKEFFKK